MISETKRAAGTVMLGLAFAAALPAAADAQVMAPRYDYSKVVAAQPVAQPQEEAAVATEAVPAPASVKHVDAPVAVPVGNITLAATSPAATPMAPSQPVAPAKKPEVAPKVEAPAAAVPAAPVANPGVNPATDVKPVAEDGYKIDPIPLSQQQNVHAAAAAPAKKAEAPDGMFIAAGQVGGHHSIYATTGVMAALPGSKLGNGWVSRVFAEEISYRYKAGQDIDGRALGGSAAFGYQHTYSQGWLGGYAGVAYHHTHLSPDTLSSKARGNTTAAHLQAEGEHNLTNDFKLNANAVVDASSNTAYWTRLRALYRVSGNVYAGPEGVYQGDKDYKSWESGIAVTGLPITDKSALGMDAGVRKTQNIPASGYAGLEFGMDF